VVADLDGAGTYSGSIVLADEKQGYDGKPSNPFELAILVTDHRYWPAGMILVSVLIAFAVKRYLGCNGSSRTWESMKRRLARNTKRRILSLRKRHQVKSMASTRFAMTSRYNDAPSLLSSRRSRKPGVSRVSTEIRAIKVLQIFFSPCTIN
jgi:hypothetical protein